MDTLERRSVALPGGCRAEAPERLRVVPALDEGADDDTMINGNGLQLLGVSFRSAPLAVREPLVLDADRAQAALADARTRLAGGEAFVLSTCNRTELYVVGAVDEALDAWHRGVLGAAGVDQACPALAGARYHLQGRAAARHLFRVASGLESALLGDNEIVGQLRAAVRLADQLGTFGPRLRLVVDHALRTSKRARSATAIGAGGAGIGSAVATIVAEKAGPGSRVALLGAGDAAAVIARELTKRLGVELVIVNRSASRAEALAAQHGGIAAGLDDLPAALRDAHAVVAATAAGEPIITPQVVAEIRAERPTWAPPVVDAGLPRNVDPACDLDVTTMDSLAERTQRVARLRERAVADVERHIHDGLARWHVIEVQRLIRHGLDQLDAPVPAAS